MMQVVRGFNPTVLKQVKTVATIGNFDGVHLGHAELINQTIQVAKNEGLKSLLITFEPLPKTYFNANDAPERLSNTLDKLMILSTYELDYVWMLRFNQQLALMSAEDFIKKLLVEVANVQHIIIGDDFRYGSKRQGDVNLLEEYGEKFDFTVEVMPNILTQAVKVSSSKIRQLLQQGNFLTAQKALGRPYAISGKVCYGNGLGKNLGFPTANIVIKNQPSPLHGVYVVRVYGDCLTSNYGGVANIGTRPVINDSDWWLEVFLFDFTGNLYGQRIKVEFLHKIRDEENYPNMDIMVDQIAKDVKFAQDYLMNNP